MKTNLKCNNLIDLKKIIFYTNMYTIFLVLIIKVYKYVNLI